MRRGMIGLLTLLSLVQVAPTSAQVQLGYGKDAGQVAFVNPTSHPGWEEPLPLGPLSFRATASDVWVADSCGGKVFRFDLNGKLMQEIRVVQDSSQALWEDIALSRKTDGTVDGFYLFNGSTQEIWRCDLHGKVLAKTGGRGEEKGHFLQGTLIEIGPSGTQYVADKARRVISVLAPDGKCRREIDWQWSGFFIDSKENIYRLHWNDEEKKTHLLVQDVQGKQTLDLPLELPAEHFNPELWTLTSKGNLFVTYITAKGFEGKLKTAEINRQGKIVTSAELTPPLVMNRMLCPSNVPGKLWLAAGDFNHAPKGELKIDLVPYPGTDGTPSPSGK